MTGTSHYSPPVAHKHLQHPGRVTESFGLPPGRDVPFCPTLMKITRLIWI